MKIQSISFLLLWGWSAISGGVSSAQSPSESAGSAAPTSSTTLPATNPASTAHTTAPTPTPLEAATQLFRKGKFAEAEAAYRTILQADSKSALAYAGLVRVHLKQKRIEDAAIDLAKALEIAPNDDAIHVAQGEVHFRQGRIQEAMDDFTPLVKAETREPRAYFGLGRVYWAASYYQHAKLMFDKAYERDPEDADIRKRWLFTLTRKERIDALKGYLSGETDDDEDERGHLETSLVTLTEAEEEGRQGCRLVNAVMEAHLPMERLLYGAQSVRGSGLKVEINGTKATLLLDTGSPGILVSRKVAEKAGIQPIAKADVHGIGDKGTVSSFVGVADSIKIGDLEFQGCQIEVMDRNSVADEDGLIGSEVFNHYLVGIDFPNGRLHLTPLPPIPPAGDAEKALMQKYPKIARFRDRYIAPELKDYTPVFRFGHLLLIPTRINNSPSKLFVIDTGAFSDTISPAAAKEVTKVRANDRIHVKGLNGAISDVFTADDLTLTFSHFRQPARDMVAFDTSKLSNSTGTEISGTLGFFMLYQMELKIDYRDGLVDFGYDPHRVH